MKSLNYRSLVVTILILIYIITFGILATRQHFAYETSALDLGNYDQAMWNAAHGRGLALTTLPKISLNRMGLHVEPILFLLVPLYWIAPNPITLLWLQTVALGLAAIPLFLIARRKLQSEWSAVAIVLAYLLLPATESVNLFDFHAVALAPFFILWGWYFLEADHTTCHSPFQGRGWGGVYALISFILAMSCKEDISLLIFMVGLYVALWQKRYSMGILLAVMGLAWAYIAFEIVLPSYRIGGEESAYIKYFPTLGNTPLEIAFSPITKPVHVWHLIMRPENISAMLMITMPFAFIGLAGLPIFILTAPALAISLLSNNPLQQELETWHYAAPMLPFIMLAVVDGMRRLEKLHLNHFYAHGRNKKWGDKNQISIMLTIILLCSSFTYHYFRGYSPLSKPFHLPNVTQHHAIGDEIAATIPQSASVMAQAELVPHISQREHVSIWTGDFSSDIDYIFFDISHPKFINADNAQTNLISTMIYESNFGLMVSRDGYLLLKREATRKPTQDGFQDFLFADNQQAQSKFVPAKFGDILSLVGMDVHVNRKEEAEVSLYFHVLQQPNDDYFIHLYLLDDMGHVKGATVFQQPVLVWWPTHLWQAGQIIKVRFNTLSWWTADRTDVFSYAVGISYEADPWDVDSRLHVVCQRTNRILILHEQEKKPCLILADNLVYLQDFKRMACMVYAVKGNDENNR